MKIQRRYVFLLAIFSFSLVPGDYWLALHPHHHTRDDLSQHTVKFESQHHHCQNIIPLFVYRKSAAIPLKIAQNRYHVSPAGVLAVPHIPLIIHHFLRAPPHS